MTGGRKHKSWRETHNFGAALECRHHGAILAVNWISAVAVGSEQRPRTRVFSLLEVSCVSAALRRRRLEHTGREIPLLTMLGLCSRTPRNLSLQELRR